MIFGLIGLSAFLCLGLNTANALQPRFVGSTVANINDYPYQLSIYYGKYDVCGAAIIAPRWAITAASCLNYRIPSTVNLRAGSNTTQDGGTVYKVSNFYVHPRYNGSNYAYNVALLNLTKPFVFGKSVKSIPLIQVNRNLPVDTNTVVTGWGFVSTSGQAFSYTLRKLTLSLLSSASCSNYYQKMFDPSTMVCTKNQINQKDICGNGGYPMVVNGTLAGIFSRKAGCTSSPSIFTKLSAPAIRSWISSIARV